MSMSNSLIWLLGKGVFNHDASFVGKVIAVKADAQGRPTMLAQTKGDYALEIGWQSVAGGKDILVLRRGFDASKVNRVALPLTDATRKGWDVGSIPTANKPQTESSHTCPTCGNKASWIGEYGRWYCRAEKKYL